ncbi:phosphorothioated DNA-binding restriction endonuclease [Desulfamplus magnetovallimortis]
MNVTTAKKLFDNISMWKKGGQRAPHKPLLILLTIAHCIESKNRFISFSDIDQKLKQLLIEFGPARKSYHTQYPFWRLQHDGLWELTNTSSFAGKIGKGDAKKSDLVKFDVHGGFSQDVYEFLMSNQDQIPIIVSSILDKNFPSSIHEDILLAIGLDLESDFSTKKRRDPNFREKILNAYEYQCAVCGFNVRVGNSIVALEAAHIKWHQAGGPDSEENGIALCALHHKLFDRGAFTLSNDMKIMVSDRAYGTKGFNEWLMAFHGKRITDPQRPSFFPEPRFLSWHVKEVFQGYERHH